MQQICKAILIPKSCYSPEHIRVNLTVGLEQNFWYSLEVIRINPYRPTASGVFPEMYSLNVVSDLFRQIYRKLVEVIKVKSLQLQGFSLKIYSLNVASDLFGQNFRYLLEVIRVNPYNFRCSTWMFRHKPPARSVRAATPWTPAKSVYIWIWTVH